MKLLIDTGVLIDFIGKKPPFYENAEKVFASGFFGDAELWIPASSFKDAHCVLSKHISSKDILSAFVSLTEVACIVGLSPEDPIRAALPNWDSYEDCLTSIAAQKAKADYIITRKVRSFERSLVPALTPEDYLQLMSERGLNYDSVAI